MRLRCAYRMYPTRAQSEALVQAFGCARVVFNDALAARRAAYAAGQPYLSDAAVFAELTKVKGTPERAWLSQVSSAVLQQALIDLNQAYRNFFNSISGKRKGPAVRMPKFRSRKDGRQSIRFAANARFRAQGGTKRP